MLPPWVIDFVLLLVLLAGAWPVLRCRRAVRGTTLTGAWAWALAGWIAWIVGVGIGPLITESGWEGHVRYAAAVLALCPPIAVLGARRPMAGIWNLVVAALVVVLALPALETVIRGGGAIELFLDEPRCVFLLLVLTVGVLNYLPTRYGPAAGIFGLAELCQL
ncbi:MAG: hypothetical protein ACOC46_03305, partial [Pirellulales bacterium]